MSQNQVDGSAPSLFGSVGEARRDLVVKETQETAQQSGGEQVHEESKQNSGYFRLLDEWVLSLVRPFQPVSASTLMPVLRRFIRDGSGAADLWLLLQLGADKNGLVQGEAAVHLAVRSGNVRALQILFSETPWGELGGRCFLSGPQSGSRPPTLQQNSLRLPSSDGVGEQTGSRQKTEGSRRRRQNMRQKMAQLLDLEVLNKEGETPLLAACRMKKWRVAQALARMGAEVDVCKKGETPLSMVCKEGPSKLVKLLLKKGADLHSKGGERGLHAAAQVKRPDVVRLLVAAGAPLETRNGGRGTTPLLAALESGCSECAQILLEAGADCHATHNNGQTTLFVAAASCPSFVRRLLETGVDVNAADLEWWTPLFVALARGQTETVRLLVERGAQVNVQDINGCSSLLLAVTQCSTEVVKLLIAAGADVNARDDRGRPLLFAAVIRQRSDLVRLLVKAGADVNAADSEGRTALLESVAREDAHLILTLSKLGAAVNCVDKKGRSPLFEAVVCQKVSPDSADGGRSFVKLLLDLGAQVAPPGSLCPLSEAVKGRKEKVLKCLVSAGGDVKGTSLPLWMACRIDWPWGVDFLLPEASKEAARGVHDGIPTLCAAVLALPPGGLHLRLPPERLERFKEVVGRLVSKEADVNAVDTAGRTALTHAVRKGSREAVEVLLSVGADSGVIDRDGRTVLMHAARNGFWDVVKCLLCLPSLRCSVNAQERNGQSALMGAAAAGWSSVVALLLCGGADVTLRDVEGRSALWAAALRGSKSSVQLLLAAGADVNARLKGGHRKDENHKESGEECYRGRPTQAKEEIEGTTALMVAIDGGHQDVCSLLLSAGADPNLKDRKGRTALLRACTLASSERETNYPWLHRPYKHAPLRLCRPSADSLRSAFHLFPLSEAITVLCSQNRTERRTPWHL
uniref:Uncharacterized protein n=1 Tax=Chromera velia CCMP2878 TaxID=1169474 RepID=A0A0G4I4I9_9ALVE|eukprot:Cvel_10904.t1-p1 / transcript=Cvel_10904.t1 / gene=Cvel_10904 / organism=Chromera_velia_CCMP2878 / gene_product=Ankyrin repeat domain-containing protein 50, putative / transcript_product=Ankyrin repeat domain-containing protein 50, putative / location=Cvel_scaffold669:20863-26493(-) / protein_length=916 / sequence_SO=supercontig / SO=protein_coding / is_pseudo=false